MNRQALDERLEGFEQLDTTTGLGAALGLDGHNVEANSLGQGSALTNNDIVTLIDTESRRKMGSQVGVSLLVSVVLSDVVKEISANDDGSSHFVRLDNTLKDTTTDTDVASEGTLLINEFALNSLLWDLVA